mmetsp:Transcript_19659/g.35042  ORF Transcript_19659/g.35042 Transcript_19659/m.35042 type:complete len:150 (+) Transcript_19659:74-523(+)
MSEHPDFTGKWLMTGYEGEPDKFMEDLKIDSVQRTAAWAADFGKGKATTEITHDKDEDEVQYVDTDPVGNVSSRTITINGEEQDFFDGQGNKQWVIPKWSDDGSKICATVRNEAGPLPSLERWLESPTEMRVKYMSPGGVSWTTILTKE